MQFGFSILFLFSLFFICELCVLIGVSANICTFSDCIHQTEIYMSILHFLDCISVVCSEPYTSTPPGAPCKCVWPMEVGLRLSVSLYTFFPLVSEFASEIATGVFMKQSQVRIMGADAANQQPDKTIVFVDLVPLGEEFDNTTAF